MKLPGFGAVSPNDHTVMQGCVSLGACDALNGDLITRDSEL